MKTILLKSIYNILGSICIGNGLWMLFSASSWFQKMPVGAEDTGPINTHFVHDVGLVYVLAGIAAMWCASRLKSSFAIHLGLTLFIGGHALIHVIEIIGGLLPASHWLIDFPLVTFPALLLGAITPVMFRLNHSTSREQ